MFNGRQNCAGGVPIPHPALRKWRKAENQRQKRVSSSGIDGGHRVRKRGFESHSTKLMEVFSSLGRASEFHSDGSGFDSRNTSI